MTNAWRIVRKDHENVGEVFAEAYVGDDGIIFLERPDLAADWRERGLKSTPRIGYPRYWLEVAHPALIEAAAP